MILGLTVEGQTYKIIELTSARLLSFQGSGCLNSVTLNSSKTPNRLRLIRKYIDFGSRNSFQDVIKYVLMFKPLLYGISRVGSSNNSGIFQRRLRILDFLKDVYSLVKIGLVN